MKTERTNFYQVLEQVLEPSNYHQRAASEDVSKAINFPTENQRKCIEKEYEDLLEYLGRMMSF